MSIKIFRGVVCFLIIALAVTCLPAANGFAADKEIVLKALSPWAKNYYWTDALVQFQKMVNERLKGQVRVNYIGGNEIVPTLEQFEALRNGVVDVILGCGAYYKGQVPEASTQLFTHIGPLEQRSNGYYDLLRKIHLEKGNVVLLSNLAGNVGSAFRLYTNTKTDKPDLSGLKVRVSSVYVALVKALGGAPVSMPPSELYAALERRVVGAYGQSYGGIEANGWHEVTKYAYKQGFYSANFAILFNVDVWNSFPKEVRIELEEIGKDLEVWTDKFMDDYNIKYDQYLKSVGIEILEFSEADTRAFLETAYEEGWKDVMSKCPENCPKLKELCGEMKF